jgi:hypothetical protein
MKNRPQIWTYESQPTAFSDSETTQQSEIVCSMHVAQLLQSFFATEENTNSSVVG